MEQSQKQPDRPPAYPLSGIRVLVTRSRAQASELSERLTDAGAEPVEAPLIRIEDPEDWGPLDQTITQLDTYDWVIFTSANAVDKFFERLAVFHLEAQTLAGLRIGVVGTVTEKRVKRYGVTVDCRPGRFDADALVEEMQRSYDMNGVRVLFPSADIARETVVAGLSALGAQVTPAVVYRTVSETSLPPHVFALLERKEIHAVVFTSSSTVKAFVGAVGKDRLAALLSGMIVACMGPITERTATEVGMAVGLVPEEATIPALVEAIIKRMSTCNE